MEDAWRIGQVEMVRWLSELLDIHHMDAYQLVSQVALSPIANAVDTNYSVVTKIPKKILPKSSAYEGMHQTLRQTARTIS
jgi:acetamidase/formamidase